MYVVPISDLATVWPRVQGWLEKAIEEGQGDENIWDVFVGLARGAYVLWYEEGRFAAVTEFVKKPRQSVITVLYCGGNDLRAIRQAFVQGCAWAKENGVEVVRIWGRPGWERELGLKRIGVISQVRL